jgi:hypothetical protein
MLQILSLNLFEKTLTNGLFDDDSHQKLPTADPKQLNLFDYRWDTSGRFPSKVARCRLAHCRP